MLASPKTASGSQEAVRPFPTALSIRRSSELGPIAGLPVLPPSPPTALAHRAPEPYADWYLGDSKARWTDPAKNAYDSAVEVIKKELSLDESRLIWLRDQTSIKDVQDALKSALQEYKNRAEGSKVRQWLASCSSRVMYYGTIFDVYVQHHPEYVSLAWGTFKFLFIAVLNHEELLVELSKAISRIADVLPRTELHAVLYPTERIQEAVSMVYAKIIEFSIRAIKWYKKKKVSHSFSSIVKPFSLSFKDIIDEISEGSRRVDELANAASKAEIRDLHVKLYHLHHLHQKSDEKVDRLTEIVVAYQTFQTEIMIDLRSQKQFFRNRQIEEIKNTLLEDTEISSESLSYCRSLRNRRRRTAPVQLPPPELLKLKTWLSEPSSSLLLAQNNGVKTSAVDFAITFLDAVLEKGYPVLWALPSGGGDDRSPPSLAGILKSLLLQALNVDSSVLSEGANPVRIQHFRDPATVEHWFKVLKQCLVNTPQVLIVINMKLIEMATEHDEEVGSFFRVNDFVDTINEIVQSRTVAGLKVVMVWSRFKAAASLETDEIFGDKRIFTDRGQRIERLMRRPKFRGLSKRQHAKFAQRLKRTVQDLDNAC